MKPIGGFFELEIPKSGRALHPDTVALTSGRAALVVALQRLRPRRVLVPFYTCNAVIAATTYCGVPTTFYDLTASFEPDLARGPKADECVIYINYFGLHGHVAQPLTQEWGGRTIIDDTHAFFASGYPNAWSFNSARKFFGVPDGSFLFAPEPLNEPFAANQDISVHHLVAKLEGKLDEAFAAYQEIERAMTATPRGMSMTSSRLLSAIDYDSVARTRRRNFEVLHQRLSRQNSIAWNLDATAVPFCYPLVLEREAPHEHLWARGLFVPKLWPEVISRADRGFDRERALAASLLPLPIDHRYNEDDMAQLADRVEDALA
jgi:hypothetical protein